MLGVVEAGLVGNMLRPRDDVVFPLQRLLLFVFLQHERRRFRRDADERDLLHVGAVGVARIGADALELLADVA